MKRKILLLIFLFVVSTSFSQSKMEITFNNGNVKSGIYNIYTMSFGFPAKIRVVSKKTKEKYYLKDIKSITMHLKE